MTWTYRPGPILTQMLAHSSQSLARRCLSHIGGDVDSNARRRPAGSSTRRRGPGAAGSSTRRRGPGAAGSSTRRRAGPAGSRTPLLQFPLSRVVKAANYSAVLWEIEIEIALSQDQLFAHTRALKETLEEANLGGE